MNVVILQLFNFTASKNFREYAQEIFIPCMYKNFQSSSRLGLVWGIYRDDWLKASSRAKFGKGVRSCVVEEGALPRNWQNFLQVDSNKTQWLKFLSDALLLGFTRKTSKSSLLMETWCTAGLHCLSCQKWAGRRSRAEVGAPLLCQIQSGSGSAAPFFRSVWLFGRSPLPLLFEKN